MICFISDQVNQGKLNLMYCPTDEIIRDFMTKPLGKEYSTRIEVYEISKTHLLKYCIQ